MLGEAGYTAFAPDWPGHGDSSKPGSGSFAYSQQAYLDSLAAFVEACGIKKPFALVVQVCSFVQHHIDHGAALQLCNVLFTTNNAVASNNKL